MKLIIDRQKWLRGETESRLYRSRDGKKCCVGMLLEQAGVSEEEMRDVMLASGIRPYVPSDLSWLLGDYTNTLLAVADIYGVNDDKKISDEVREAKLTKMFAARDIQVEFIN